MHFAQQALRCLSSNPNLTFFFLDKDYRYKAFSKKHFEIMQKIWNISIFENFCMLDALSNQEDKEKAKLNFDRVLNGESFILEEEYGDNKFFRTMWENNYSPVIENNAVVGICVFVNESTKQLKLELDYSLSTLFEKLLNFSTVGITLADANDKDFPLIFVNDAFRDITGYSKEEILGRNCKFLQNEDTEQEGIEIIREAIRKHNSTQVILRNYKKDGTLFYNLISLNPIFNANGLLVFYVGIQSDITKYHILSEKLSEIEKYKALSELMSNIAHHWRQPLSLISTAASSILLYLELGTLSEQNISQWTESILNGTKYLTNTINTLSELTSNPQLSESYDISDIFYAIESLLKSFLDEKNIIFDMKILHGMVIGANKNTLTQAIMNILSNSIDILINQQDLNKKIIMIDTYLDKNFYCISIKDNGKGIDSKVLPYIFEPYFTTKHKAQGTGLGLYFTRQTIITHYKGDISAENVKFEYQGTLFQGADFLIKIPLQT